MNKSLLFCVLIFSLVAYSTKAQENFDVYITTDSSIATVDINIPKGATSFQFFNSLPSYYDAIFPQDYVETYTLTNSIDSSKTLLFSDNTIYFEELHEAQKVEFRVHENYQSLNFIPISTKFSGDWQLFNFAFLLGEIGNKKEYISIYIDSIFIGKKTIEEWCSRPYFKAQDLNSSLTKEYNIITHQSSVSQEELNSWIVEAIEVFDSTAVKDLIFIFDDIDFQSGAIAHDNSIVFYFDEKDLQNNPKYLIQKTIIHELLHGVLPEAINHPYEKSKIWLSEGLTEYLALKKSLENSLISETVFLEKMMEKQRLATKTSISLEELSLSLAQHPENYLHFYSKGVIACWLMDLELRKATQNQLTLENIVMQPVQEERLSLTINEVMADFEEKYVSNNESLPFNEMIADFGILYEFRKNSTFYPIQQVKINEFGEIIATSKSYPQLQIGDTIVGVNSDKKIDKMITSLQEASQSNYTLTVLKNGNKEKIELEIGRKKAKINYHNFSFINEPNETQIENWRKFVNL